MTKWLSEHSLCLLIINSANFMLNKKQKGQGMTEYIIIVALIAIAAIGIFGKYGDVVDNQTSAIAKELSGQDGQQQVDTAQAAATAASLSQQVRPEIGLSNYQDNGANDGGD